MPKFRKKPVTIEAFHFSRKSLREDSWPAWLKQALNAGSVYYQGGTWPYLTIETLEGTMRANLDDWVICGVCGEIYPVKPDIFAATYEAVDE